MRRKIAENYAISKSPLNLSKMDVFKKLEIPALWAEIQRFISCLALAVAHASVFLGSLRAFEFPRSL